MTVAGVVRLDLEILAEAERFLTDRGADGMEGTGLMACRVQPDDSCRAVTFVAPDQRADRPSGGCWVEITERGKRELAVRLPPDCRYLARIHSHPGEAFHSPTDDANPALTHEGALSIVVPYFGLGLRRGLAACAVFRLASGRWFPLPPGPDRDRCVVCDG